MFNITGNKGFHMQFDNGFRISVQWGAGNYGGNYDLPYSAHVGSSVPGADTAEIAIFSPDGNMVPFKDGDTVQGYVTTDQVLSYMNAIASCTSIEHVVQLLKEH